MSPFPNKLANFYNYRRLVLGLAVEYLRNTKYPCTWSATQT